MKNNIILGMVMVLGVAAMGVSTHKAQALSCLPVDMYLESVVGNEDTTIFVGTAIDQIEEEEYTAEVISVSEVMQGYAEEEVFVYHEKNKDWGYLCNNGPKEEGAEGLYIATRNENNKLNVTQRLDLDDPLAETLKEALEDEDITGTIASSTEMDHKNQLMTIINDLIAEIKVLIQQYSYWNK